MRIERRRRIGSVFGLCENEKRGFWRVESRSGGRSGDLVQWVSRENEGGMLLSGVLGVTRDGRGKSGVSSHSIARGGVGSRANTRRGSGFGSCMGVRRGGK